MRRAGAACIDLAYTACGRYDGFWEVGLSRWDIAAGVLLVREAGGHGHRRHGRETPSLETGDIVAAGSGIPPRAARRHAGLPSADSSRPAYLVFLLVQVLDRAA